MTKNLVKSFKKLLTKCKYLNKKQDNNKTDVLQQVHTSKTV